MSKRAKRLEKYLSALGWETSEGGAYTCTCGARHYEKNNFCQVCGEKSSKWECEKTNTIEQLESAIAYAVGETKVLP
jgi:hypothetical protein